MYVVPLNTAPIAGASAEPGTLADSGEASGGFASLLDTLAALLVATESPPVLPEVEVEGDGLETVDETPLDATTIAADAESSLIASANGAVVPSGTAAKDSASLEAGTLRAALGRPVASLASKGVAVPIGLKATAEPAPPQPGVGAGVATQASPDADALLDANLRLQGAAALAGAARPPNAGDTDVTSGAAVAAQAASDDAIEGSVPLRRPQSAAAQSAATQPPVEPDSSAEDGLEQSRPSPRIENDSAVIARAGPEAAAVVSASTKRAGPEPAPTPTARSSGGENVAAVSGGGESLRETVTVDRTVGAPRPPVPAQAIAQTAIRQVRYLVSSGDDVITVRLVPESLGELHVTVRSSHNRIEVHMASANPAVRDALEGQMSSLRDALSRDGIDVTRATVSSSAHGDANTGGTFRETQGDGSRGFDGRLSNGELDEAANRSPGPSTPRHQHTGTLDVFV